MCFRNEISREEASADGLRRRAAVSKTAGRGFESLRPCQHLMKVGQASAARLAHEPKGGTSGCRLPLVAAAMH